jgi:molecular chaperone DnaK (HSP70)
LTKDRARFAIGIDLGTTNSALAFAPLVGEGTPEVLLVPQWEGLASLTEKPTLPSFLYLPEEAVAAHLRGEEVGAGQWIVGLLARMKASEAPGRVVHSAKSWLCHHAADRSAPFLPWGSTVLAREQKISPVRASALILNYLRGIWNSRFAQAGFAFDDQDITVTVPASFDAAAQRLTITAAEEAGFPGDVRLLEEPQAAFYCWLESHDPARELWQRPDNGDAGLRHVLVIDIGGGTSDFSIFEIRLNEQTPDPDIRRVAVSEHTLLGGDNIDLAVAHFLEPRLAGADGRLSGPQWDLLVAACRHLKEHALAGTRPPDERFVVALAGRRASGDKAELASFDQQFRAFLHPLRDNTQCLQRRLVARNGGHRRFQADVIGARRAGLDAHALASGAVTSVDRAATCNGEARDHWPVRARAGGTRA